MDGWSHAQLVRDEVGREVASANPVIERPSSSARRPAFTRQVAAEWPGKRVMDITGATLAIVVLSPIILCIAAWLALTGGPILFGHTRIGRGNKVFTCYKFRTMVPNAEEVLERLFERAPELRAEWLLEQKIKNDPRITRLGALLRKSSLDELPQLWNVIKGDMSLVGPRPIVREETLKYGHAVRHYLAVRPGITGLWQVSGRNNVSYSRRVALDRMYARRSSLALDVWILMKTPRAVIGGCGAY